jgi:protein-arginine kinase
MFNKFPSSCFSVVVCIALSSCFFSKNNKKEDKKHTPLCIKALNSLSANEKDTMQKAKTSNGVTLDRILKSGVENQDSSIGCYAGDAESYNVFAPIFDTVIKKYHNVENKNKNSSDVIKYKFNDRAEKIIKSTRIRVARNIAKYPFPSTMTKEQRISLENEMKNMFKTNSFFKGGIYKSLKEMPKEDIDSLVSSHILFKDMTKDRFILSSGIANDYPEGRGIYISKDKKTIIWVNEEDHLIIISTEDSPNIKSVYNNLQKIINILSSEFVFATSEKYGTLTSCPTNIGTGMKASVHIELLGLGKNEKDLKKIARKMEIDVRGEKGERSSFTGVVDISNKGRYGKSKEDYLNRLILGVNALASIDEVFLEGGDDFDI